MNEKTSESKMSKQKFKELLKGSALATSYSTFLFFLYLCIVFLLMAHNSRDYAASAKNYLIIVPACVFAIPSCFFLLNIANKQKIQKFMMMILPIIISVFAVMAYYPENTLLDPLLKNNTLLYSIMFIFFLIILVPFFWSLYWNCRSIKEICIFIVLGFCEFFIYGSFALMVLKK